MSIKFGLIGVGGIGAYHRASIERLEREGAAVLVAVADPTVERLPQEKADLEGRGVRWHLDYREMLRLETELDAVVIATPIPFHYDMTRACLERGLWVHLEKPPVPLLGQLDELMTADTKRKVSVGFQMIGSHCLQVLRQLIADGKLGTLRSLRAGACWPRLDGYYGRASWAGKMMLGKFPVLDGPATNALAHLVHNIMWLAAERPGEFTVPREVRGEVYRARPMESYDTACLRGRFDSGVEFSLAVTHATETMLPFSIVVQGTEGWARLSNDGAKLETNVGGDCERPETTQELLDVNHANFREVVEGRSERFLTHLADARGFVGATNAMLRSSGGIHAIVSGAIREYRKGDEVGFEVEGLREAVERTILSGELFSEQGCAWATARPKAVLQADFGFMESELNAWLPGYVG